MKLHKLKNYNPVTPSLRGRVIPDLSYLDNLLPEKSLKTRVKKHSGRNYTGSITCRHQGGRHKRSLRYIDFNNYQIAKSIISKEYDPNRTAIIARCINYNFKSFYIIPSESTKKGLVSQAPRVVLKNILPGSIIYNIGNLARSAGSFGTLLNIEGCKARIRLPSKKQILICSSTYASIGKAPNKNHKLRKQGKAGANR